MSKTLSSWSFMNLLRKPTRISYFSTSINRSMMLAAIVSEFLIKYIGSRRLIFGTKVARVRIIVKVWILSGRCF